jgi:SAM-dependent methyltransferase
MDLCSRLRWYRQRIMWGVPPVEEPLLQSSVSAIKKIETSALGVSQSAAIACLRRELGFADFSALMFSMPDARFPNLSKLLPRMASPEVQKQMTGASGQALLAQTIGFVRTCMCNYFALLQQPLETPKVLDYGCGYGRIARLMYYYFDCDHLFGLDPWTRSISECHEAGLRKCNFRQSDYVPTSLPINDSLFNFAYAFSVFTHLSAEATTQALSTLRKYVHHDGLFIITIRPVEYWEHIGYWKRTQYPAGTIARLIKDHRSNGFAFLPEAESAKLTEHTYGETSMTVDWLASNCPEWRVVGIDRSLDDRVQLYVILRPC